MTGNTKKNKKSSRKGALPKSYYQLTLIPILAICSTSIALIIAYLGFYEFNANLKNQQQRADLISSSAALQLNQTMRLLKKSITLLAADDRLLNTLITRDFDTTARLEGQINNALPFSLKTRIIPLGRAKIDRNSYPPLTFTSIDIIQKVESGSLPPPEAQIIGGKSILNWAKPITSNGELIGTLFVSFDANALFATISPPAEGGLIQVLQTFAKAKPSTLLSNGKRPDQDKLITSESPTDTPNWTILYLTAPQSSAMALLAIPGIPLTLAFLLGASCFLLSVNVISAKLRSDNALLLAHIEELQFRQYSVQPLFSTHFMASLNHTLERLLHDTSDDQQPVPPATAQVQATALKQTPQSTNRHEVETAAIEIPDFELPDELPQFPANAIPSAEVDEQPESPHLPSSIFRAYDIRGIVDKEITPENMSILGQAIGSEALEQGQSSIFVGRDGRLSSPALSDAVIRGLLSSGIDVIDIGLVPTPLLWFASHTQEEHSGVMVTGSHNPANYNGLKIMIAGTTLSEGAVSALRDRIIKNKLMSGNGQQSSTDFSEEYISHIAEDVILAASMNIVIDSGNGATGKIAPALFRELGCNVTPLYCEIDGNFPNHHPDPSREENLEDLKKAVQQQNADLGLAFDGDGDRIGIVTKSGKVIWPDRLMMLYAKDILVRQPGSNIIFDVKCSRRLPELITSLGGRPIMWKTGHALIKSKLKETNAALAGEMSGHIFFNDRWFGFDDALYCGARLLEILSTEMQSIDEVFSELPESLATPELLIPVPENRKFDIIRQLESKGQFGNGKITTIDGIRVDYPKAWGLVRASNTTPALTARFEAQDQEALEQIQALFQKQLHLVDENISFPNAG